MVKNSPQSPSFRTVLATAAVASVCAAATFLSKPAALRIDGHRMVSDMPPITTAKGAYVPLRAVATSLGADMDYDAKTGAIELLRGHDTLRLKVGERSATFDGKPITLGIAPFETHGRTMVSLGTVARAFRTKVRYEPARARIDLMTGNDEAPATEPDLP